jgi:hypothetical protein
MVAEGDAGVPVDRVEGLEDAAGDGAGLGDGELDGVEQGAPVLGAARALGADAAQMRAQGGATAPRDDEPRPLAHDVVEHQRVRAAHQLDAMAADELEERRFADAEAPLGVGREAPIQVRAGCA